MTATGLLDIPAEVDTPRLVIDRRLMQANIADMASFAADLGVGLAPHAKTHRTPEIARLQVDAGAEALCIAKLGEAEVFHESGIRQLRDGLSDRRSGQSGPGGAPDAIGVDLAFR